MRLLLFDSIPGGHHPLYMDRFSRVLGETHEVVVAAPAETLESCTGTSCTVELPDHDGTAPCESYARRDLRMLDEVTASCRPDHVLHLFADATLSAMITGRRPAPTTILVFRPRAHYPSRFRSELTMGEIVRARAHEALVTAWRNRRQAHHVWSMDPEAARRWERWRGAPVSWLPEPPVVSTASQPARRMRSGAVLYGRIAPRKGLDEIARAFADGSSSLRLTIAGPVAPQNRPWFDDVVARIAASGAIVSARPTLHDERSGIELLSSARCVLLPYVDHFGMSRVLLEAAQAGTPVVATSRGLIGHYVERHGLGLAVDPTDARALRHAVESLADDPASATRYAEGLRAFAQLHGPERFAAAVSAPFRARIP